MKSARSGKHPAGDGTGILYPRSHVHFLFGTVSLSNFMIDRDANRGQCAHPCRWKYKLVEEQRPGEYYPVEEDDRGLIF